VQFVAPNATAAIRSFESARVKPAVLQDTVIAGIARLRLSVSATFARKKEIKTQTLSPNGLVGNQEAQPTFLVAPAKFETETKSQNSLGTARIPLSLVARDTRIGAIRARFRSESAEVLSGRD
jgi:hypothetical protein